MEDDYQERKEKLAKKIEKARKKILKESGANFKISYLGLYTMCDNGEKDYTIMFNEIMEKWK